jgi:hypothetical protein
LRGTHERFAASIARRADNGLARLGLVAKAATAESATVGAGHSVAKSSATEPQHRRQVGCRAQRIAVQLTQAQAKVLDQRCRQTQSFNCAPTFESGKHALRKHNAPTVIGTDEQQMRSCQRVSLQLVCDRCGLQRVDKVVGKCDRIGNTPIQPAAVAQRRTHAQQQKQKQTHQSVAQR